MVNTLQLIIAIHILSITQSATNSSNRIVKNLCMHIIKLFTKIYSTEYQIK
nr:hypothetical protein B11C_110271 [Bartonella sp. 1-1C]